MVARVPLNRLAIARRLAEIGAELDALDESTSQAKSNRAEALALERAMLVCRLFSVGYPSSSEMMQS